MHPSNKTPAYSVLEDERYEMICREMKQNYLPRIALFSMHTQALKHCVGLLRNWKMLKTDKLTGLTRIGLSGKETAMTA